MSCFADTIHSDLAMSQTLTHLKALEAESIHIIREVVAEFEKPVMLYSVGKDSAVMLHLPERLCSHPLPLDARGHRLEVREMIEFGTRWPRVQHGVDCSHQQEGSRRCPITHGSKVHTDIMKTQGLKQALNEHKFDAAFGGARRDEEKSRAKERVYSFRDENHRWDPKNQRPELWNIYNGMVHQGESIRVFPLSNWTELDVWQYIWLENIPIVPLYLSAKRPIVMRNGVPIMVDDDRLPLEDGEVPEMKMVRFRTLGCYPLTGAVESEATTLPEVIQEMLLTKQSERQGRVIDYDQSGSMEEKKREGYF